MSPLCGCVRDNEHAAGVFCCCVATQTATAAGVSNHTTLTVTVASGTNYYGTSITSLDFLEPLLQSPLRGTTYRFDQSDASNSGHPLRLSTSWNTAVVRRARHTGFGWCLFKSQSMERHLSIIARSIQVWAERLTHHELTNLVRDVKRFMEDDGTEFSDAIDTFIDITELSCRGNDSRLSSCNLRADRHDPFISMPSDMVSLEKAPLESNSRTLLQLRSDEFMMEYWPDRTATGSPRYYSYFDDDTMYVAPDAVN